MEAGRVALKMLGIGEVIQFHRDTENYRTLAYLRQLESFVGNNEELSVLDRVLIEAATVLGGVIYGGSGEDFAEAHDIPRWMRIHHGWYGLSAILISPLLLRHQPVCIWLLGLGLGVLLMGGPTSEAVRGSLDSAARWRLNVDALDAAALRARFPWFSVPDDAIGSFEADAGIVRPEASVHAAIRVARAHGADLLTTTRVHSIDEDADRVTVRTAQGTEHAGAVIICAGAWTARLLPELAPLLRVTRQVQAWVAPRAGIDATGMPCSLLDRGPGQPAVYGLAPDPWAFEADPASPSRLPKVALHGSDDLVDPELGAAPPDARDLERVHRAYSSVARGLAGDVAATATCLYTMSPDGNFLLGTRRGSRRSGAPAQGTPDMTVRVKPGFGFCSSKYIRTTANEDTDAITAPTGNPRIDVVQISHYDAITIKTGSEAASPSAPAVDANNLKLAEIYCRVGMTSIKDKATGVRLIREFKLD